MDDSGYPQVEETTETTKCLNLAMSRDVSAPEVKRSQPKMHGGACPQILSGWGPIARSTSINVGCHNACERFIAPIHGEIGDGLWFFYQHEVIVVTMCD